VRQADLLRYERDARPREREARFLEGFLRDGISKRFQALLRDAHGDERTLLLGGAQRRVEREPLDLAPWAPRSLGPPTRCSPASPA
jgi:hypothetical protein